MSTSTIRRAGAADIPFLIETCLGAEQGAGKHAPIARVFGLTDEQVAPYLAAMFGEEVDGCEFSVSSFLIVEEDGMPAAAVAGWIEGAAEDGLGSNFLRTNLIGYTFPPTSMAAMRTNGAAVKELLLPRSSLMLQLEYVYTSPSHRGKGYARKLIGKHIYEARTQGIERAQVQVFADNKPAILLYESMGFSTSQTAHTEHPNALQLVPAASKLLMERSI